MINTKFSLKRHTFCYRDSPIIEFYTFNSNIHCLQMRIHIRQYGHKWMKIHIYDKSIYRKPGHKMWDSQKVSQHHWLPKALSVTFLISTEGALSIALPGDFHPKPLIAFSVTSRLRIAHPSHESFLHPCMHGTKIG